ncbi:hypothetical protein G5I_02592 [Acromyrmex echinatior]|uniref:Uncharacterized protein n=1 Tax=Acromyrmex echinatior TaxID=103372 RepID=F4WAQ3_ACREC|nr:hypothetical protein G5I_02592 [Acromyrmex echinatior]
MSNLRDFIRIRYEYPVEGYLMVDNEPQVRLQLRNEVGMQVIPSVNSVDTTWIVGTVLEKRLQPLQFSFALSDMITASNNLN